jgi:GNAT superfamily N-acetyltransferase
MLSEDIAIRPATPEDVDQLWPLVKEFGFSYRPERRAFAQSFTDLIGRSDTLILAAATNTSAIVGYLLGSYHGTFFANGPVAWIEELMVSESARSQGVATKLMSSAEEWARSIPAAYVALASRRAGDFYLRIGYEESATYYRKTFVPPGR